MNSLFGKKQKKSLWVWLLIVILLGMIYFGLRPKEYDITNHVEWLDGKTGVSFRKYGLVYAQLLPGEVRQHMTDPPGFSMEMALQSDIDQKDGFNFIVSLHSGKDREQLLVGQWRSSIVVMGGDDYDHTRRDPRISVDLSSQEKESVMLTIASGKDGTRIYIDGQQVKTNPKLKLQIPPGPSAWLTLGNSVYGKHSWSGDFYSLAIYGKTLSAREVETHFQGWKRDGSLLVTQVDDPLHLYLFDEGQGEIVHDHGQGDQALRIPSRMQILKKKFLDPSWMRFTLNSSFFSDFVVNLLGFVPLGFVLTIVIGGSNRSSDWHVLMITAALCFVFSLSIEVAQAWIPSRSSSLMDLVLNTLGGGGGAFAGRRMRIFN
jgi:hypothetical protein